MSATWGALASGNGLAHLNEILATFDSPTLSQSNFSTIENEISHWWKDLLETDFSAAIEEEKNSNLKPLSFFTVQNIFKIFWVF